MQPSARIDGFRKPATGRPAAVADRGRTVSGDQISPAAARLSRTVLVILEILGVLAYTITTKSVGIAQVGVPQSFPVWFVTPFLTGIILFHGNFYADFSGFLLYVVVWLSAWFGILITDYLLRHGSYHALSLRSACDGLYWRHDGVHWPAIIAQVLGMAAALMWLNADFAKSAYTGPLSNHFPGLHGGDFSWAIGIVVGALAYWALAGRNVRKEAASA